MEMSSHTVTANDVNSKGVVGLQADAEYASRAGESFLWRLYVKLFPKPFDLVSTLLYLGAISLYFFDRVMGNYGWQLEWVPSILVVIAIVALLVLERWEWWFFGDAVPPRVSALTFVSRMALIEVVAQIDNFSFSPFLYLVIPFSAFLYKGMRFCYLMALLVLVVYVVKLNMLSPHWYSSGDIVREFLIFAVGLLFVITMAQVVGSEMRSRARSEMLLAQLEESHRQLRAYAEQVGELAATKERNRLARDIHDSLGHYLTVINVQLEKALAFKEARPVEADRAMSDAKRLASEALRDVRRSVGALRATPETEPFLLRRALEELVGHTDSSELSVRLKIEGSEEGFAAQGRMALYRAAQEGLTNIQKHSGASEAAIDLQFGPDKAVLRVSDNGKGVDMAALQDAGTNGNGNGGYGLQGLEERVALLGGNFRIETTSGKGTTLCVEIPKGGRPQVSVGMAAPEQREALPAEQREALPAEQ